ncbi:hypothetical protein N7532_010544 [Penicillium argentinense]|uniref:Uncharacterized protein n=1 Tax=Penicillium argentinense TaxID=1131581 RepID=A0A9W9EPT6_9EURO|nr:uncharacterized protein N7532_010544 [Penicillium argentinense]KAJ5085773.1 hypothetical protein N7532_010544 [Penicillium argentinense]
MSSDTQSRPGEQVQQSTNKWQQSTKDLWRRSTQVWSDSKDKCHQSTMEAWHRSSDSLANSKQRYQQSTAEAWHRSTNTWVDSKTRCRQSTADMLNRSATKLYQSTDRLQRLPQTSNKAIESNAIKHRASKSVESLSTLSRQPSPSIQTSPQNTQPQSYTSPPSSEATQSPQSGPSSESSQSTQSPSEASTDTALPKYDMIDPFSKGQKQEQQIRQLLNMTDQTFFQIHQAKQLRNSKSALLGEIEHNWINSIITDALHVGQDLAKLVEPHRLDMAKRKGKITSANRKRWKIEDCQKAQEKQSRLILHQDRLSRVFTHLRDLTESQKTSPDSEQGKEEDIAELGTSETSIPELSGDSQFVSPVAPAELPSDPIPTTVIAELPGDSALVVANPTPQIPKIIITQTPGDVSVEYLGSPDTPDHASHETNELDEILAWRHARNDVRSQQSTSLSNIIARMDSARVE